VGVSMDLLESFRQKAEELAGTVNRQGGLKATIDSLRRQMAEADRRRAMGRAKSELKQLNRQINEMIMAIGVQAVGLYKAGQLTSMELRPLCQHVADLQATVAQQETELARLEAETKATVASSAAQCSKCGRPLPAQSAFCPFCGNPMATGAPVAPAASAPPPASVSSAVAAPTPGAIEPAAPAPKPFCARCGAVLRPGARFCARCGQTV
jgi:hypothetical protein